MDASREIVLRALRFAARALLAISLVLLAQFLLGITVNLFIDIPKTHPGAGLSYVMGAAQSLGWVLTQRWPYLALHALMGLGLVANSLVFLVRGHVQRQPAATLAWNYVGAFGATFAALNGLYFLVHPDQDGASMLMAVGFAIAMGAVAVSLFRVGRPARTA